MLERKIGVARHNSKDPAPIPAETKVGIEREGTVDQRERHVSVLAEEPEDEGSIRKDFRIFWLSSQGAAREIDRRTNVHLAVARTVKPLMAKSGQGKCGAVPRIALDRLPEEFERPTKPVVLEGGRFRERTEVEIIGRQILGRAVARPLDLGCAQSRFYDAGDTRGNFVL